MKKQKKIIYFSVLLILTIIIIITFNTQNIEKIFLNFNNSNLNEKLTGIPIEELNIEPIITNMNKMIDKDFLIGRYQFNYTGSSSGFSEYNTYNFSSGFSHIDVMLPYEEGNYANSSGAYLESNYNNEGTIYKAYLIIESSNVSDSQDYPITLIYGGEDGTPINGIKTKMSEWYLNNSSSDSKLLNRIGYIDITDYVKTNGYGWYYCCNIPFSFNRSDSSADWKIVVIEENPNIPIRALKFQMGNLYNRNNSWSNTTIDLGNITTKKESTITGQFLYNMTSNDGINSGKLQIYNGTEYKNVISQNGYRTVLSPLPGIKTRNTIPIKQNVNYPNNLYYIGNNENVSENKLEKAVLITGADIELLDIDGTTNYHNITIENNKSSVILRFNPYPYWLEINMFGIAYDIDSPEYVSSQKSTVYNEYYVNIEGTIENISNTSAEIGMYEGKVIVSIDKELKILSTNAHFSDSNGNKVNLTEEMYEINYESNTITYIYGEDTEGKSLCGDKLTYNIETMSKNLFEKDTSKYTVFNEVTANGKLIYDNNKENYEMDNVIWTTSNATLFKPLSLTIKPNGGVYEDKNTDTIYKIYTEQTKQLNIPIRNGYTFKGWSIEGEDSRINENIITIGTTDVILTANWEIDKLTLNSSLKLSNNKGSIELDWSNYDINNKYFVIYRKQEGEEEWKTIVSLDEKFNSNKYIDNLANDQNNPSKPNINIEKNSENNSIEIIPITTDSGTKYSYYIEAYDLENTLIASSK